MQKSTIHRRNLAGSEFDHYKEIHASHGSMRFQEISFDSMQFIRCDYALSQREQVYVDIEDEVLEMHFRLNGASCVNGQIGLGKGQHTLAIRGDHVQEVLMEPVANGAFYEIRIGKRHFEKLIDGILPDDIHHSMPMTPGMYTILAEIAQMPYHGRMKHLFLEAKMTELLLLQVGQDRSSRIPVKHADRMYEAKAMIEQDFLHFSTIAELSKTVGINQRQLMQGFKALFGQTIYHFVSDLKMNKAKELLQEGSFVNEVADMVGYKNPQHFTTAFKKKFGILPGKLKL